MFKTSAIFAALLLAGGGAASAAEIGVRHTWGNSSQHIRDGLQITTVNSNMSVHESSAGFILDVKANDFSVEAGERSKNRSRFGATLNADSDVDLRLDAETIPIFLGEVPTGNADIDGTIATEGTIRGRGRSRSSESEFLNVDGRLTVQGSGYYRTNGGTLNTGVTNSYTFSGNNTSGFSELSTFSR